MTIYDSLHRTSTGKIFQLTDLMGDPMEYSKGKEVFKRNYLAMLDVGQTLRSLSTGMMLKRIK